ncbi:NAD(P)/FAD-dependent oxidoreductase [Mycobacterium shinjukuense]|uniref:Flavin-binding monooxygenase n=1 Tax=Mycobacterium shinjukuense TaxID=398694 RepID=A0A7I7MT40_9MYCO|nr:NAD(P)/FAD-dependent oxidoreductase [Mycobacterium shinjukuense]MCV6986492.1 NAD(P)/FAD-dependent oxidoreductase [Mycobacterium shinjukuense]ORB70639.1 FAD-containing monooxygenase EthA [Mycobacterium shinjukuense]BBX75448.1 flavin-binding monooxygenase [Mycobacterium shinjukuense]
MNSSSIEHVDVLIVGAGISGIGAAHYLQKMQAAKTFAIVEARADIGGTWDLFRYPGIRSDSDLHTFSYEFKAWENPKAIATADAIMSYLREAVAENGIENAIRFGHKVIEASWSTKDAHWLVEIERRDPDQHTVGRITMSCRWLFCASGYYRYDAGYTPELPGRQRFTGQIVHPQHWPQDLDYRGKRVVIIGSGATAVTLVPAIAETAGHVTMLQRSPTYIVPVPSEDRIANALPRLIGRDRAYSVTRRKNIAKQRLIWRFCQQYPRAARRLIRHLNAKQLPPGYPVDEHFRPAYNPWDQRLCAVPDADMFRAIRDGRASVVTDRIDTFTERGILLRSGRELAADIIVTATGLNLLAFGGISLTVDGQAVNVAETVAFKGFLLSEVPNFAYVFGYTNSSWTLKVGLVGEHFCRLLAHMDAHGHTICYPQRPASMPTRPLLEITSGYAKRAAGQLPQQGIDGPWRTCMDYRADRKMLRDGPVDDDHLRFTRSDSTSAPEPALTG